MMDRCVFAFANVAVLGFDALFVFGSFRRFQQVDIVGREAFWREDIGRGENGFAAQSADACLMKNGVGILNLLSRAGECRGFLLLAASDRVGIKHLSDGAVKARAIFGREFGEEMPMGVQLFEKRGSLADFFDKSELTRRFRWRFGHSGCSGKYGQTPRFYYRVTA